MKLSKRLAVFLAGLLVLPLVASATFPDVPSTHPYYEAINFLQNKGIIKGYSDGTFQPEKLLNRAEFLKITLEAFAPGKANGKTCTKFPDAKSGDWFLTYVCYALENNIINGYPDGTFKPAQNISFVEAAKVLSNLKGFSATPATDPWYKVYVQNLAKVNAIAPSINKLDQLINRGEMAEMTYRLHQDITSKPSKTYEELAGIPVNSSTNKNMNAATVSNGNANAPVMNTNTNATAPAAVKEFTVSGQNHSFSPSTITVKKGDTVKITFKNVGGFHDLVIDELNVATKQISTGQEETVQFVADKVGTFEFYCSVGSHRAMGMKGSFIVQE